MKRAALGILLLPLLIFLPSQAQVASSRAEELQRQRAEADLARRMRDMRLLERRLEQATKKRIVPPAEPELSPETRERILRQRRVAPADLAQYSAFLNTKGTGIIKIFPDLHCISKNVVIVSEACDRSILFSSAFTFRTGEYGDEMYHDIHFDNDRFTTHSFFAQGIFVEIGNEPIENIALAHPALAFLAEFSPAGDPKAAAEKAKELTKGIESRGFKYSDSITPVENASYAFRTIAYRLDNSLAPISDQTTMNEMMFHSLSFDKRLDLIVVFRLVRKDEYGGLTLVWREFDRRYAAKIKFGKNQPLKDFRPDSEKRNEP